MTWPVDVDAMVNASEDPKVKAAWKTVRTILGTQESYNGEFEQRIRALENRLAKLEGKSGT
jgi:hypothetical protein